MHLDCLRYFEQVAEVGSISKVASFSHVSQPALSQQIQKLEEVLGYKLLIRSNKGVELTEPGEIVNKYAKNITRAFENMLEDLEMLKTEKRTIRIDCTPTIATYALPCAVYKIKERYPALHLEMNTNHKEKIEEGILSDNFDIGFIIEEPQSKELASHKVFEDEIIPVVPGTTALGKNIDLQQLTREPMILLDPTTKLRKVIDKKLSEAGVAEENMNLAFELDTIESVKSTVLSGYGVSFLPYVAVKKEIYTKQLRQVSLKDCALNYEVYMVYKKDNYKNNKDIRNFTEIFKQMGTKTFC